MAICTIRSWKSLQRLYVLAPERYDPRRESLRPHSEDTASVPLSDVAQTARSTIPRISPAPERYLILDTSDAQEGVVVCQHRPVPFHEIGSTKKIVQAEDVLISRLRPYLHQIAFVDRDIRHWEPDVTLICSTEFFVLRSVNERSIAFLVPLLLSAPVQKVLAAAQEGGHHPRFNEATLLTPPIPNALLNAREEISRAVERCVQLYRESERGLLQMTDNATSALQTAKEA